VRHTKPASRPKGRKKAVPTVGVAGVVSLLLAAGASAGTSGPAADTLSRDIAPPHKITLSEEEITDVSLATFDVSDKENARTSRPFQVAHCRGCGGCRQQVRKLQKKTS
jgi:hypothetical protein